MASNAYITPEIVSSVIREEMFDYATLLAFRDLNCFREGKLHRHTNEWDKFFQYSTNSFSEVQDWIPISSALKRFSLISTKL